MFDNRQLDTLRNMLGINDPNMGAPPIPWRNYAAVNPGDLQFAELERLGAVEKYLGAGEARTYDYFRCTLAGQGAAIASHASIRWPAARRRYAKFLDLSDCFPGLTFREFLTHPEFKEARHV